MAKTSTGFFGTSNQTTGGFLDDVDATATFRAVNFDRYTSVKDVPGILVTYTPDGGEPREEFYPVGHAQKITARKDGSGFDARPGQEMPSGMSSQSKGAHLFRELERIGVDLTPVVEADDVRLLDGLKVHVKAHKEKYKDKTSGQEKESTTVLPVRLISGPGKASKKGTSKAASSFDVEEAVKDFVVGLLQAEDDLSLPKAAVAKAINQQIKDDEDWGAEKQAITKLVLQDKLFFQKYADEGVWEYDKKTLTLTEE